MIKREDIVLVITGCMRPNYQTPNVFLSSYDERRKQYISSIRFYIENTFFLNIVYCDNSGEKKDNELENIAKKLGKNFEWLSFFGDSEKAVQKGKGFGEGEIMQYVISYSKLFQKKQYFAKVTGRLKVLNINWIFKLCNLEKNYFSNASVVVGKDFVDTRFFMINKDIYCNYFYDSKGLVDDRDDIYLEHIYARKLMDNNISFSDFPFALNIEGVSGSTGNTYKSKWWKIYLKSLYRIGKLLIRR